MALDRDSGVGTLHLVLEGRLKAGITALSVREHNRASLMGDLKQFLMVEGNKLFLMAVGNPKLFHMAMVAGLVDRGQSNIRGVEAGNEGFGSLCPTAKLGPASSGKTNLSTGWCFRPRVIDNGKSGNYPSR
jgi:hypothetical protein